MSASAEENAIFEERYKGRSAVELARSLSEIRAAKDALEEQASALGKEHDYLSKHALPKKMEDEGLEQLKIEGVGRVNLRSDVYASIPASEKAKAFEWLRDNGRADMISETVNASTLKASIRQAIEKGEPFPEGLFKVTPYTFAVITKR